MYLIPEDIEIRRLENATITQVCYCSNIVNLHFETTGYITIIGEFVITQNDKSEHYEIVSIPITTDFGLLRLMDKKTVHVFPDKERRNLIIKFEDDSSLELINDKQYESFIINIDETTITI